MMKLLKGAVFFIPVNCDDTTDQSDGSSQNSEISTQPVVAKLSSIDVYQDNLSLLEESVKVAETLEAISVFKQSKNPMVRKTVAKFYGGIII